ncbi:MAG: V-type ATP synthase subunit D [Spirochaetia bacterium]|nr:V-type ATP synthase subunit D [Spirochaetia bacterium]
MELKFQFNKVSFQKFQNDVKVRMRALPILRAKEGALRGEVSVLKRKIADLNAELIILKKPILDNIKLFSEFPDIIKIKSINTESVSIAGVRVKKFRDVNFDVEWFSVFQKPKWFLEGVKVLKDYLSKEIQINIENQNLEKLIRASKKTTQKVNLYEKIQIPAYNRAMLQIKRFLEDEENLSRAGQKIMKKRRVA